MKKTNTMDLDKLTQNIITKWHLMTEEERKSMIARSSGTCQVCGLWKGQPVNWIEEKVCDENCSGYKEWAEK